MTDFDKIIWSEALTLIDFFASWCGPCRAMEPTLDRIKTHMNGRVKLYKVDIDDRNVAEVVRRYNIASVPTLIIFRHGEVLWRQSGVINYDNLVKIINQIEQSQPSQ